MSAYELSEMPDREERPKKRAPWGVIALVLLTGLALIRNGSGEFDIGP
ncbi:class F sortase, partial [Streptomyces sp. NPDC002920]